MSDHLAGIAAFVEAAEAGSFARAASRLGLSRSAVGKTVARLEARLGARLFQRTTRRQRLTEDGQLLYERCARALAEIEAAQAALDSGRREPAGRLRVSAPVLFGRRCVAPILLDLARRHPKLEVELSLTDRVVDLVEEGFDLVVRSGALPDSAGLMGRRLLGQRLMVCAAPVYLAARGAPRRLEDLAGHDAVAYGRGRKDRPWSFPAAGGSVREITPSSRIRLDDLEAVADAAAAGLGLAYLPDWLIADRLRRGELVGLLAEIPGVVNDVHAVWPQAPHLPLRVRVAIDALAARLPEMMSAGELRRASTGPTRRRRRGSRGEV